MSIIIRSLNKFYKNKIQALNDVNLKIDKGLYGLLGQNGAGKSTLMKILTMLLEPTSGEIEIYGKKLNKTNEMYLKSIIGYMPQDFGFYNGLTVKECLEYMAILKGISTKNRNKIINNVIEDVNLFDHKDKKYKELSGGMKRRLGLAQAILGSPEILIVDEPTVGVDPKERIKIRNILSDYSKEHIVLLSTHIIEDIAITCKRLAILHCGSVLYDGTLDNLLSKAEGNVYKCILDDVGKHDEVVNNYLVVSSQYVGNSIEFKIISEVRPEGMVCQSVSPSLEDAYMFMTNIAKAQLRVGC